MAHVYKRIKSRISRCVQDVLELHGIDPDRDTGVTVRACIEEIQRAQARVNQIINTGSKPFRDDDDDQPAKPVKPPKPRVNDVAARFDISYPRDVASPVYGPQTGVMPIPHKVPKLDTNRVSDDDEMDYLRSISPPPGFDRNDPKQFVEVALAGRLSSYEDQAAYELWADQQRWTRMDWPQRMAAVKQLARDIEACDDEADLNTPEGRNDPRGSLMRAREPHIRRTNADGTPAAETPKPPALDDEPMQITYPGQDGRTVTVAAPKPAVRPAAAGLAPAGDEVDF